MNLTKKTHSVLSKIDRKKEIPEKLSASVSHCERQHYIFYLVADERYELSELGQSVLKDHRMLARNRNKI